VQQVHHQPEELTATMVAAPQAGPPAYDLEPPLVEPSPFFGAPAAVETSEIQSPEAAEGSGEYNTYGHIVDLSVGSEPEAVQPSPSGFIKDPLRRVEGAPPQAPIRTQHLSVTLSRAELKQGGTIRVVLDLRVEN
jgi:hypothetical protein